VIKKSRNLIISKADLVEISQRSRSLSERFGQQAEFIESSTKQQNINKRLNRWCKVVAEGDWEKFKKRLDWDNLDIEQIRPFLDEGNLTSEIPLLPWTDTLIILGETAANFSLEQENNQTLQMPIEPEVTLPFEEVFLPAIFIARQKLSDQGCCSNG